MATIGVPVNQKKPANVRGLLSVFSRCGQIIVQSWPKKRGEPKTEYGRGLVEWFGQVSEAINLVSPYERVVLEEFVSDFKRRNGGQRGSAIIRARDWYQRVAMGRMWKIVLEDGSVYWPETVRRDVSDALDILVPTQGSLLVRTSAEWTCTKNEGGSGMLRMVGGEPRFDNAAEAGIGNAETAMGGYAD